MDADAKGWQTAFGRRVRELGAQQGLSQMALPPAVGLHPTYISRIERVERSVSLVNIHRLAIGLNTALAALLRQF